MVQLFNTILENSYDSNGDPISGSQLFIYEAGTTTKLTTFSDSALTTANANPLIADSAGRFSTIYGNPDDYKFVLTTATDTDPPTSPIQTTDDYTISATAAFSGGINAGGFTEHLTNAQTGTSYTILTGDRAKRVTFSNSAAVAVTLPQANSSTFPDGWYVIVINKGAGLATITPTTSTIGGLSAITLTRGQSVQIYSDGTNYDYEISNDEVGTVTFGYTATPPVGKLLENGDTLGSASSGATNAAAIFEALYQYYWNNITDTFAPVSTGRGASAAADFAADKTLTMPDNDKRVPYGAGTTASGETNGAATVAATGTNSGEGLTIAQMPAHTHTVAEDSFPEAGAETDKVASGAGSADSSFSFTTSSAGSGATHTHTFTGSASSVDQLGRVIYWHVKY